MAKKDKTVTVRALQAHTYQGASYEPGDMYDIPEALLASIIVQRKAERAEPDTPAEPETPEEVPETPAEPEPETPKE